MLSKQKPGGKGVGGWRRETRCFEMSIIGLVDLRVESEGRQCFRVRADVFASAHGRPDGMPGRIVGARAKVLPG